MVSQKTVQTSNGVSEINVITFTETKTRRQTQLPISNDLMMILKASKGNSQLTFVQAQGNKPYSVKSFGNVFSDWAQKAGIDKGFNCHGLRHHLGNSLADANANQNQIAAALGHQGTKTVATYTQGRDKLKLATEAMQSLKGCLLYTSPSPRDGLLSRMPSSA